MVPCNVEVISEGEATADEKGLYISAVKWGGGGGTPREKRRLFYRRRSANP